MVEYTIGELEDLLITLEALGAPFLPTGDTPYSAILNMKGLIKNYIKEGPEKIKSKIKEFADIGWLVNTSKHPYYKVYALLYEIPVEELPLYLDTPYDSIAVWRLSHIKG